MCLQDIMANTATMDISLAGTTTAGRTWSIFPYVFPEDLKSCGHPIWVLSHELVVHFVRGLEEDEMTREGGGRETRAC